MRQIVAFIPDDSFYFFKIAENIVAGRGVTFDGINPTNGFQPLWLFLLVPLYAIYHGSPETMTRIIVIIQALAMSGLIWLAYRAMRSIFSAGTALVGGTLFVFWVLPKVCTGMESLILVMTILLAGYYGWRAKVFSAAKPAAQFLFGIALGLIMLSRLDHVFIGVCTAVLCGILILRGRASRREAVMRALMIGFGGAIIVAPYLVYNAVQFGSLVPISGHVKSTFPVPAINWETIRDLSRIKQAIVALSPAYLIWYFSQRCKPAALEEKRCYLRLALVVLAGGLLLHFAYTVLFVGVGVMSWYFVVYNLFFALCVTELLETYSPQRTRAVARVIPWLCVAVITVTGGRRMHESFSTPLDTSAAVNFYETALWMKRHTTPTDIFAVADAGVIGYFSQRQVVNLDGVVNTMEYQKMLRDKNLNQYLLQNHVTYLCYWTWTRQDFDRLTGGYREYGVHYFSWLYRVFSEDLIVRREDEVYRSSTYRWEADGTNRPFNVLIWKISQTDRSDAVSS
jgi:hypothetical protein